jgi:hypothetical protein
MSPEETIVRAGNTRVSQVLLTDQQLWWAFSSPGDVFLTSANGPYPTFGTGEFAVEATGLSVGDEPKLRPSLFYGIEIAGLLIERLRAWPDFRGREIVSPEWATRSIRMRIVGTHEFSRPLLTEEDL